MDRIEIKDVYADGLSGAAEGVHHDKILPCLSVVQAVHGSYDIALGDGAVSATGEGGVFIAPAGAVQHITHHAGADGIMDAQWVFLTAEVNGLYRLEEFYRFPLLAKRKDQERIFELIREMRETEKICIRYARAYELTDLLLESAEKQTALNSEQALLRKFVSENYANDIKAADLAKALHLSEAQIYRLTKKYFGQTPANYINAQRLQHAARKFEDTNNTVTEVALSCGFSDFSYFSKLFKKIYGVSPAKYRKNPR